MMPPPPPPPDHASEEIEALLAARVEARNDRKYVLADEIKADVEQRFGVILTDIPRKEGGGTVWHFRRDDQNNPHPQQQADSSSACTVGPQSIGQTLKLLIRLASA